VVNFIFATIFIKMDKIYISQIIINDKIILFNKDILNTKLIEYLYIKNN